MIVNVLKEKNENCMGCGICSEVCQSSAISMEYDSEGFLTAKVDPKKCTECKKCVCVCPQLNFEKHNEKTPKCFAGRTSKSISDKCTAGGAFYIFAKHILKENGVVCGVEFKNNKAEYVLIDKPEDIDRILGAKYIEAELNSVFCRIKKLLNEKITVLFCGTPCHVNALYAYLDGTETDLLITVDFVCHGVSSPAVIKKLKKEKIAGSKIDNLKFSSKKWGFRPDLIEIIDKDKKSVPYYDFSYFHNACISLRKSCYHCQYAPVTHNSDLTLGIFYGIEKYINVFNSSDGISLILLNSEKGNKLFNSVKAEFDLISPVPIRFALENNRFFEDYMMNENRTRFFDCISRNITLSKIREYIENSKFDVGLVTNWSTCNFGAQLTHYSLYCVIREMGLEPLMVEKPNTYPFPPLTSPILFRENPYPSNALSRLYGSIEEQQELNRICDAFIVGSDQVWNQKLFDHAFDTFTLGFVNPNKKKISYATSFGIDNYTGTAEHHTLFKKRLGTFQFISVREATGKNILKKEFGLEAAMVLDPVFLAEANVFDELTDKSNILHCSPYVFAYMRWSNHITEKIIIDYAKKKKNELVCVSEALGDPQQNRKWSVPVINVFIEDWLCYIKNAHFVFTDSFHAICFSIIFKKNFLCIIDPDIDGSCRMYSLLRELGLEDRIIADPSVLMNSSSEINIEKFSDIDYGPVYEKLKALEDFSKNWLKNALKEEIEKLKSEG